MGSANTAAAEANAYEAGVAAGASASKPAISPNVQGNTYCLCGNTWFQPGYGANGVFYQVVAAP